MVSPGSTNRKRDGWMKQQAASAVTKVITGLGNTNGGSGRSRNPLARRGLLTKSSSDSRTSKAQSPMQAGGVSKQKAVGSSSARSHGSGGNSDSPSSATGGMIIPQSSNSSSSSSPASSKGSEVSNISDIVPLLHGECSGLQRTNSNGSSSGSQHHAASSPRQTGSQGGVMVGGAAGGKMLGGTVRKLKAIAESEAVAEANTSATGASARTVKPNYGPVPFTYAQVRPSSACVCGRYYVHSPMCTCGCLLLRLHMHAKSLLSELSVALCPYLSVSAQSGSNHM